MTYRNNVIKTGRLQKLACMFHEWRVLAMNPEVYEPAEPTRVQPARERRHPDRTLFVVHNANASHHELEERLLSLRKLREHYASVAHAASLMTTDFIDAVSVATMAA